MVQNSDYLDLLWEGDVVLADRGFTIGEDVGRKGATLSTPAFKKSAQLTQLQTEESRRLSNVRIHVERVIGSLRMRLNILRGPVSMAYLKTTGGICFYDKVVAVCCVLHNLNPSVVPFD